MQPAHSGESYLRRRIIVQDRIRVALDFVPPSMLFTSPFSLNRRLHIRSVFDLRCSSLRTLTKEDESDLYLTEPQAARSPSGMGTKMAMIHVWTRYGG